MPTRTSETKGSIPFVSPKKRRLATVVLFAVVFVVVDVLLCLALEPYGAHTEMTWTEYRQTKDIDTVVVGTSTAAYGMHPQSIDAALGSHTFNMATQNQSFDNSLVALKTATSDHDIERVIMCIGYETLVEVPYINASIIYTQAKCAGESPTQILVDVANLVGNEYYVNKQYSLTCAMPWAYDHVNIAPDDITANITNRLECDVFEAGRRFAERYVPGWGYESRGFSGYSISLEQGSEQGEAIIHHEGLPFSEYTMKSLGKVFAYCRAQSIPLYVFGARYTPSAVLAYGDDYLANMRTLERLVEDNGGVYMDLNMIHRDVLDTVKTDYWDHVHLNKAGAPGVSTKVGELIDAIESGESVNDLFYPYTKQGWQDYLESIDYVDTVDYTCEATPEGIVLEAYAYTGSSTSVEYRFEVYDDQAREWRVVRDYAADPKAILSSDLTGKQVRIFGRAADGKQPEDRWAEGTLAV